MSELTREQIEDIREDGPALITAGAWSALCDMALRTLDAEARNRKLERALRPFADAFQHKVQNPRLAKLRRNWNERMPDEWPIAIEVTMSDGRTAREALAPPDTEPAEREGSCLGCRGGSVHHTCGRDPNATPAQRRDALDALEAAIEAAIPRFRAETTTERTVAAETGFLMNMDRVRSALSAGVPDGYTPVPNEVLLFLQGAGPLNGRWYWTADRQEPGPYWWRRYLPLPAHAAPKPQEGESDE